MRNEEPASPIIPTSSFLAPAGRVAVKKPKEDEEEPAAVVSSSSSSLQATPSVPVKQEVKAEVKAEDVCRKRSINDDAHVKNDWEPGNWCWLLDDANNCHTAPVLAVQEEAAVKKEKEEETEMKVEHEDVNFSSAPQIVSSFSSSRSPAGSICSKKEEENEEEDNTLHRDDEEETATVMQAEHDDDAVASAAPFVASSVSSDPSTIGIQPKKGNNAAQNIKLRPGDDDDNDENNNHKIRHSTDRTNSPDPFDDTWMAGSWCWERPTPNSGGRSDGVAAVAAGSTCRKRSKKRKVAHHHDSFEDDDWTTNCWCWEPPNTNSGINGVALAAAAASTGRRKKQKGLDQSHESRYIIPGKHNTNIGHDKTNNSTDIDEVDDADDILECRGDHDKNQSDDDNYDGTDSDYDSVDDGDARVSDNSGKQFCSDKTTTVHEKRWNKMYGRLLKYKIPYKCATVPRTIGDDARLGRWVRKQRCSYNRNLLSSDRIDRLESIGFVWNVNDTYWIEMYERLVAYKKQYKSTCVPSIFPKDKQLGVWVHHQRFDYKTKNPRLTADKISRLVSIDFVWSIFDARWTAKYERLIQYKKRNKSTCVPFRYEDALGKWVNHQRIYYKTKDPRLTADRITQLDSIGFVWSVFDAQWKKMYDRLLKYQKKYKTTCVPRSYPADPQLGQWVNNQRTNFNANNSKLAADRIAQLDSIGFVWNCLENKDK